MLVHSQSHVMMIGESFGSRERPHCITLCLEGCSGSALAAISPAADPEPD